MSILLWGRFAFPMHMCLNLAALQTFGEISCSTHSVGGSVIVLLLPSTQAKAGRWVPWVLHGPFPSIEQESWAAARKRAWEGVYDKDPKAYEELGLELGSWRIAWPRELWPGWEQRRCGLVRPTASLAEVCEVSSPANKSHGHDYNDKGNNYFIAFSS